MAEVSILVGSNEKLFVLEITHKSDWLTSCESSAMRIAESGDLLVSAGIFELGVATTVVIPLGCLCVSAGLHRIMLPCLVGRLDPSLAGSTRGQKIRKT